MHRHAYARPRVVRAARWYGLGARPLGAAGAFPHALLARMIGDQVRSHHLVVPATRALTGQATLTPGRSAVIPAADDPVPFAEKYRADLAPGADVPHGGSLGGSH